MKTRLVIEKDHLEMHFIAENNIELSMLNMLNSVATPKITMFTLAGDSMTSAEDGKKFVITPGDK